MSPQELVGKMSEIQEVCVNLLLTRRCNYKCLHCMYASGPHMPADYMRWEDLLEARLFVEELQRAIPEALITTNLIGGEPSLDMEELERIVNDVVRWGCRFEMTTNGWWLEKWETFIDFGRAVRPLLQDGYRIRILYHEN